MAFTGPQSGAAQGHAPASQTDAGHGNHDGDMDELLDDPSVRFGQPVDDPSERYVSRTPAARAAELDAAESMGHYTNGIPNYALELTQGPAGDLGIYRAGSLNHVGDVPTILTQWNKVHEPKFW